MDEAGSPRGQTQSAAVAWRPPKVTRAWSAPAHTRTTPSLPPPRSTVVPVAVPAIEAPPGPAVAGVANAGDLRAVGVTPIRKASRFVRFGGRANLAVAAILLCLMADMYELFSLWEARAYWAELVDGVQLTTAEAQRIDDLSQRATVIGLGAYTVAGAAFMAWFHRAYKNLAIVQPTKYGRGWTIGAWFVPILNLFRPAQIMEELVLDSPLARDAKPDRLVWYWWASWATSFVIAQVLFRIEPDTGTGWLAWHYLAIGTVLLRMVAGVVLILLVRQVTKAQHARRDDARQLSSASQAVPVRFVSS